MSAADFGDARLPARFWDKALPEPNSGCWIWTACLDLKGYGQVRVGGAPGRRGRMQRAHRAAYQSLAGPIPEGLQLDHLCRVRCCVNPAHLEPVTSAENARRGLTGQTTAARQRALTHCRAGHPYEGHNLIRRKGGGRDCRACKCARQSLRRRRVVTAAQASMLARIRSMEGWYRSVNAGERLALAALYRKGLLVRRAWRDYPTQRYYEYAEAGRVP